MTAQLASALRVPRNAEGGQHVAQRRSSSSGKTNKTVSPMNFRISPWCGVMAFRSTIEGVQDRILRGVIKMTDRLFITLKIDEADDGRTLLI